jgi:hypothetical protein
MKNCRSKTNIRRNRDYVGRIAEIRKNIVTKTILKILVYNTTNGDDLFERWGGYKGRTVFHTLFLVPGQKSSTKNWNNKKLFPNEPLNQNMKQYNKNLDFRLI